MDFPHRLTPDELCRGCDPEQFDFETTLDLEPLEDVIGQPRAVEALRFGIGMERHGYNIYALGPDGTGKHSLVSQIFDRQGALDPVPCDWCYVYNFQRPHQPRALQLPAGRGAGLRHDMERLVEDLRAALSAAFESEDYQARRTALQESFKEQQEGVFEQLQQRAREHGMALVRTPAGLMVAPVREGEVLSPEEIQQLPEEERKQLEEQAEEVQEELQKILNQVPRWQREMQERLRGLNREISERAVADLFEEVRRQYTDLPEVVEYLNQVEEDVLENTQDFLSGPQESEDESRSLLEAFDRGATKAPPSLRRYRVNVLVDHSGSEGAPVIYEDHPTYQNLVGRVEYAALQGALLTDFNLIKPGALHRAAGGYLILDARKVLLQPFAWEGLKRALKSGQIRIESPGQMLSLISTISLEPEPIPLKVKVALLGDRLIYYLLCELDPDFDELFKVAADFEEEMDRSPDNQQLYARLIATLVRQEGLRPLDRSGVARIIERSARRAGDAEKLSAGMRAICDLLREADYWAGLAGAEVATGDHVQQAVDAQVRRADRVRERMREEILRGTILIDTEDACSGQVNGLSVIQLGSFAFGRPSRITAQVRLGSGEVVNIEREVELSGPLHSKGVLILAGFLGARYAAERPLSLSASLVFEQSYGGVEGDSASSAELYALLSAIAQIPLKQSLAVTGSVNQHGQIQAIGGVNEKIEGFFDVCRARGLTGEQGVLIPASNVKHLMLRRDVIQAVREEQFHIYPVETVDQGIELLTGLPAGERDEEGKYPAGSVNFLVEERLEKLAGKRREWRGGGDET